MNINVWAHLLDELGQVVPGSQRCGHNIITNFGREWMAELIGWDSVDDDLAGGVDVPFTERRIRWIGAGEGTQPEVETVVSLHTPLEITTGIYLAAISEPTTFPTAVSMQFHHIFVAGDISFGGAKTITELALYADRAPAVLLDDTIGTHTPVAYKVLDEGLVKMAGFSLELFWELKF